MLDSLLLCLREVKETTQATKMSRITTNPAEIQAKMDGVEAGRAELTAYQKCVKGDMGRIVALTYISGVDGASLDPESCTPISKSLIQAICHDVVLRVAAGMKVNGTPDNWNCGFLGSRWFDIDGDKYGVDYIRAAFYSRKSSKNWQSPKPYAIIVTIEKSR